MKWMDGEGQILVDLLNKLNTVHVSDGKAATDEDAERCTQQMADIIARLEMGTAVMNISVLQMTRYAYALIFCVVE